MPFDQHHEPRLRAGLDRRDLFKGSTVTGGLAAIGTSGIGAAHAQSGAHSGMLRAHAGLDRMGQQALAKEEPWISGSNKLIADYGTTSGGFDDLGFGTLTHTR
ncbi:twin-arginine translocation signal domain-containing protein [Glycomyces rhizosphaerae]|uniref:Twin-arginine translocation signal domain-containing protein n=1 Tax=Glycomyces rhizosphaerae TaxID=2054422 RepID=A0ABV7Q1P0_9ACTN